MSARLRQLFGTIFLLAALLLSSCSALHKRGGLPPLPLFPPSELGQRWQLSQLVTFYPNCGDTITCGEPNTASQSSRTMPTLQFIAAWSVTEQGLSLVGLTTGNQILMTIGYDGNQLSADYSPMFSSGGETFQVPGRDIISLLQLTYWPLDKIHQQLKAGPWHLLANGMNRDLYLAQDHVLSIHATALPSGPQESQAITINNIPQQHRLKITTLTQTVLP